MDETKTPTRDEIPEGDKWDLSHLFSSADKWGEDFAWIQKTYPRLTDWKGRVGESAQTLAKLLEFDKTLDLKIERVSHYASLQLAEDSANPDYLARMGQLQNLSRKSVRPRPSSCRKSRRSRTGDLPSSSMIRC